MFDSGIHEKPDLPEAYHERRMQGIRGPLLPPGKKLNLGLVEMQFPAVLRGLHTLLLVNLLLRSQFLHPLPLTLTISMQIGINYKTHIFQKWGGMFPQVPRGSASAHKIHKLANSETGELTAHVQGMVGHHHVDFHYAMHIYRKISFSLACNVC